VLWRPAPANVSSLSFESPAPIFGWLLVSAWAKRLPFLWAFLPLAHDRLHRKDRSQHGGEMRGAGWDLTPQREA